MTTGFVTMPEGLTSDAFEQGQERERQHAVEVEAWQADGRELFGYQLMRDGTWQQRGRENTVGLPAALVEAARQAIDAENAARAAYQVKDREAFDYVSRHALSAAAANVHIELHRAETWTALVQAEHAARRACGMLGKIAEEVGEERRKGALIEPRRRAEETRHRMAVEQIDQDERAIASALARMGVS